MPVFQTYDAVVNLKLSNNNQVAKSGLTAAEIMLMRAVHGGHDAVHSIKHTGAVEMNSAELRAQLDGLYSGASSGIQGAGDEKVSVAKVIGPAGLPLPTELEDVEHNKKLKPPKPRVKLYKLAKDKKALAAAKVEKEMRAEAEKQAERLAAPAHRADDDEEDDLPRDPNPPAAGILG